MKKSVKISLISLGSVIALIAIVIAIVLWIVFTPARMTKVVRDQLPKYLTCQTNVGSVELTFFSTFPEFGLKINRLTLINPMAGAVSDTLLDAGEAVCSIDFKAFMNNDELIINHVLLENVTLNAYVNKAGKANFDVYRSDTTQIDTSAFENPFKKINMKKLVLENAKISYVDETMPLSFAANRLRGTMSLNMIQDQLDAVVDLGSPEVSLRYDTISYIEKTKLDIHFPFSFDVGNSKLSMDQAKLGLSDFKLSASGTVAVQKNDDVNTDIHFSTEKYGLNALLALVPKAFTSSLEGMKMDGVVSATGTVKGVFNEVQMPVIDLDVRMDKGTYEYTSLPAKMFDMQGNARVNIDMNDSLASYVQLYDVSAKTGQSTVVASGEIDHILASDMLIDLDLDMNLNLPELEPFMPEDMDMQFTGRAKGTGNVNFLLSDAMNFRLDKMNMTGQFVADDMSLTYDSLYLHSDITKLKIQIPNTGVKNTDFMNAVVWCDNLKYEYGKNMSAIILNADMIANTTNLTETDKLNRMNFDVKFSHLNGFMDGMQALLDDSKARMQLDMNFNDSVSYPTLACDFDVRRLKAVVDDTTAMITEYPKGKFSMRSENGEPEKLVMDVDMEGQQTFGEMGAQKFMAKDVVLNTNIIYDDTETNTMLQWKPTGNVALEDGHVVVDGVDAKIDIPTIQFNFTPDEYIINDSRFIVDDSDFRLKGTLSNVGNYLKNKGLLKGNFDFTSDKTDVYRLLELTNGFGADTTEVVPQSSDSSVSTGPYMVPKGVDLQLNINIKNVDLGFDIAKNVLGLVYVRDGVLALENLRFNTSAAKLQLTAMYETPRRNHLYLWFDYHMMDMEIGELFSMIPSLDSIMPMLRSFSGKGEFHFAVETNLDSMYNIKKSTLQGIGSVKGEDLVLMDGETFTEIAKKLLFSKKTKNKVDSLSVEFQVVRNNVEVYPFLIVMDKYKAVVAGRHNLDMSFNYHISLIDSPLPFQLGVDVKGTMDKMKVTHAKCKYARMYRPASRKEVDLKKLEIMKKIRETLKQEVIE
ncbi:MAG: AsmA-like C-terminal region-containing protein [Paludibacter sp.]|nr:AsmA-like C-terminal region-containing protein [Paludibacter sp.]